MNRATRARGPVHGLYRAILAGWNARDAAAFADSFTEDGHIVGFDGSQVDGRNRIAEEMRRIFADHPTGTYVGIIEDVRLLGDDVAILRAVSGVVPAGAHDLDPRLNAVQTLIARHEEHGWRAVLYQNTPAQLHGRPDEATRLTARLRAVLTPAGDRVAAGDDDAGSCGSSGS